MKTKGKRKTIKVRKTRKQIGGELLSNNDNDLLIIIDRISSISKNDLDYVIGIVSKGIVSNNSNEINKSEDSLIREKNLEFLKKIRELKEIIQNEDGTEIGEQIKEMHKRSFNIFNNHSNNLLRKLKETREKKRRIEL